MLTLKTKSLNTANIKPTKHQHVNTVTVNSDISIYSTSPESCLNWLCNLLSAGTCDILE